MEGYPSLTHLTVKALTCPSWLKPPPRGSFSQHPYTEFVLLAMETPSYFVYYCFGLHCTCCIQYAAGVWDMCLHFLLQRQHSHWREKRPHYVEPFFLDFSFSTYKMQGQANTVLQGSLLLSWVIQGFLPCIWEEETKVSLCEKTSALRFSKQRKLENLEFLLCSIHSMFLKSGLTCVSFFCVILY